MYEQIRDHVVVYPQIELPPETEPDVPPIAAERVTWWTPWAYLFGNRAAINAIAATPAMLWVGLLLVISAGFAREYDGEDLLHEPWHVAIPVGASLVTSFMLFCLCELHAFCKGAPLAGFWPRYRVFLTLYWMTAPLAWLYAIPVERYSTAGEAVSMNLNLLQFVSVWRVLLITRVISVMYHVRWWGAIFAVVLFGTAVLLAVLTFTPFPIFSIMGGIRLSEGDRALASFAFGMRLLSFPVLAVSFVGLLAVSASKKNRWRFAPIPEKLPLPRWFWAIPAAALAIWIPILPRTQPEQQLRYAVERDLRRGDLQEALATLAAHQSDEFPPHWDPPPRIGYRERKPDALEVALLAKQLAAPQWVQEMYLDKLVALYAEHHGGEFEKLQPQQRKQLHDYVEAIETTDGALLEFKNTIRWHFRPVDNASPQKQPAPSPM